MQEIAEPITGIGIPRYAVIKGDKAYVSCWSNTYYYGGGEQIAIIDLQTKMKVGSMPVSYHSPEGLQIIGNYLYVAVEGGVEVYDTTTDSHIVSIKSTQSPKAIAQQMVVDKNNKLWVSLGGFYGASWAVDNSQNGFMCVDPTSNAILSETIVSTMGVDAEIAISPIKDKIYYISGDIYSEDGATSIYAFDVNDKTTKKVVSGIGFYGIGVDPVSGYIYTANVNGVQINSDMQIYKPTGELQAQIMAGTNTCRFLFVKGNR